MVGAVGAVGARVFRFFAMFGSLCASPLMASKWSEISVTIRTRSNDVMMREKRI